MQSYLSRYVLLLALVALARGRSVDKQVSRNAEFNELLDTSAQVATDTSPSTETEGPSSYSTEETSSISTEAPTSHSTEGASSESTEGPTTHTTEDTMTSQGISDTTSADPETTVKDSGPGVSSSFILMTISLALIYFRL